MKKIFFLALIIFGLGVYHSQAQTADEISAIADGPKILVLNYHQIDNKANPLSVLPADFETQMKFLVDSGCITITPDELYAGLNGEIELPPKPHQRLPDSQTLQLARDDFYHPVLHKRLSRLYDLGAA